MRIGINRIKITPPLGIELAGFETDGRKAESVYDDLYAAAMALEHEGRRAAVVCADVIGFGMGSCGRIKAAVEARCGLKAHELLLSASHTHSGPQTCENMSPVIGRADGPYNETLTERIVQSVSSCMEGMEDCELYTATGRCGFGVNRRRIEDGKASFAPNEGGTADREVPVIKAVCSGRVRAVIFSYACHPSTVGLPLVTADYPGRARKAIQEAYPGAVALFLQGCCGNIRVRTVENERFRTGTMEEVEAFGRQLGEEVTRVCEGTMEKVKPSIAARQLDITLPLEALPPREKLRETLAGGTRRERAWAERLLAGYDCLKPEIPYSIQRVIIGKGIDILALEGEVCVEYGLKAKELAKDGFLIAAGYCNRNPGYIPTRRMLTEGGYEPEESRLYYLLPSPFNESAEGAVIEGMREILCEKGGAA